MLGHCPVQTNAGFDEGWGMAARWLAWQSAGCPGVIGDNGGSHALASGSRGNVRVVSLGVGCGGCDEGDGEGDGRGGIVLVDRSTTCRKNKGP